MDTRFERHLDRSFTTCDISCGIVTCFAFDSHSIEDNEE